MEQESTTIELRAVYLQFRDRDNWYTVRDYDPSPKHRLYFYDNRVREYINLDILNLEISYTHRKMGIRGNLPEGVLVRGNIIDRLRLALRLDNEWIYMSFNIEKIEGKPALTHVKVEVTDLKALEGVVDIEMEDQTIFKHGQS